LPTPRRSASRSPAARALAGILGAGLLLGGGQARAEGDPREAQAKKACAAGRVDEGVELLAELFTATGDVNYVYNQGRCYQQNGVAEKAINRFREYLRRAPNLPAGDRAEVEGFITELERQRAVAPAPPPPPDESGPRLRTVGLVLGGVGAVALGTGIVLSAKVKSAERSLERDLANMPEVDQQYYGSKNRAGARLETFQWVAYGLGAAALAGGAACYLLGSRAPQERAVALGVVPTPGGLATSLLVRY
jgi:hypothetical protein